MPFVKGQSGNPGGRKKALGLSHGVRRQEGKKTWRKLLEIRDEQVQEPHFDKETGKTVYFAPSIKERREACKLILAYCWGLPPQKVEVTGEDGEPIEHRHGLTNLSKDPKAVDLARQFTELLFARGNGAANGEHANGTGDPD